MYTIHINAFQAKLFSIALAQSTSSEATREASRQLAVICQNPNYWGTSFEGDISEATRCELRTALIELNMAAIALEDFEPMFDPYVDIGDAIDEEVEILIDLLDPNGSIPLEVDVVNGLCL